MGYVLAISCSTQVVTGAGKTRADVLTAKVPKRAWQRLPAGRGARGHRWHDWAVGDLAYYRCYSPEPVPLATLVRVAGSRWRVEETFQAGKELAGLDAHQVRRYPSWARWVTLAMLAHAFLAVVRADEYTRHPSPDDLIPLTCNEIQRLSIALVAQPLHHAAHRLGWSAWRRRHQARSSTSHYRQQAATRA